MKSILVQNVRVNGSTAAVRFAPRAKGQTVVCSTRAFPGSNIVVRQEGKMFVATTDRDVFGAGRVQVLSARTPQRAFARAVRRAWTN